MTFQEKFDELKKKYGKVDESKLSEPFAVQINMTEDESSGTFYVAYIGGVFSVEPYDYRDHTAMITVPVALLEEVLSGKADPVAAFLAGKLAVEGSAEHALAVVNLMKPEKKPRKPRAKKTDKPAAEKKAAPAEPAAKKAPRAKKSKKAE